MAMKIKGNMELAGVVTKDGEFIPLEFMLNAFIPRSPKDKEPYIKVYGEKVLEIIKSRKLKASELGVFIWFIGKSSKKGHWANEWITVDYEDLAKEIGVSTRTVKSAIKSLLNLKFIIQWKPRKTVFRLNPDYCFRGGIISKKQVKKEIDNLKFEEKVKEWREENNN